MGKKTIGDQGEEIAALYLEQKGYKILKKNYRIKGGELDIICKSSDDYIVFVEVKSFLYQFTYHPLCRISEKKKRLLIRTATHYLLVRQLEDVLIRFDVLVVNVGLRQVMHFYDAIHRNLTV